MKVLKSIETCTISWRDPNNRSNDFILYPGDFFFISENVGWERKQTGTYSWEEYVSFDMLVRIYHNKMIDIDGNREWTWVNDINLINPCVDGKYHVRDWKEFCPNKLEDVSLSWDRDKKLAKLLHY